MNKTSWIVFTIITLGILVILVTFSGSSRIDVKSIDSKKIQVANSQNGNIAEHVSGKIGSKVTLLEYGDFQCTACAAAFPRIKLITEQYKNQLQFAFRNFPLGESHPNGRAAAAVVEAAGLQGKYWEMFDKIYETQDDWTNLTGNERTKFFENYANGFNLNMTEFRTDLSSQSVINKINYDYALGAKDGVDATPTYFLNGVKLDLAVSGNDTKLKDAINTELKKAGIPLPAN